MTFLQSLLAWQNVLFTTTLGLGTLLFGAQAVGAFGSGSHDADGDADADHDPGGHDVDHHADHALEHHVDHAGDHHADHALEHHADHAHAGGSVVFGALKSVGVGLVPLSLLLPLGLVAFGILGLTASLGFGGLGRSAATFEEPLVLPMLGVAATGTLLVLRVVSRLFARLAPDAKTASDRWDLLGLVGVVKSTKVDGELGQVRVKDGFGNELEVPCVARDPARPPRYGAEVVLIDWDPARNRFEVVPFEDEADDEELRLREGRRRARELRIAERRAERLARAERGDAER